MKNKASFVLIQSYLRMETNIPQGSSASQIAASIDKFIRAGHWGAGHQLPAVRALADSLGVNPNTVAMAYKALRDAGIVITDGRRGTRVVSEAARVDAEAVIPEGLRDMASGNIDGRLLPRLDPSWLAELDRRSGYDVCEDHLPLIELARRWCAHAHGRDQPAVFSGGLDAIERALVQRCRPGAQVLVEDPCWPPLLALLSNLRLKAVPLVLDRQGAMESPPEILLKTSAIVVTARAQNPTGVSWSEQRWQSWQRLLARAPDTLLIVDDYWGALSSATAPPLKTFSTEWVYVQSVSKFLGPDLRIALVFGNGTVLKGMKRRQTVGPRWVSALLQSLAARAWQQMLDDGSLHRAKKAYSERRQALIGALSEHGVAIPDPGEGLHLWLPVSDETGAVQSLAAMGWAVQAGRPFRLQSPPGIRVSIGNLNLADAPNLAHDIAQALTPRKRTIY